MTPTTRITICGLRAAITRMMQQTIKMRDSGAHGPPSLYLFREDGHMLELYFEPCTMRRDVDDHPEPVYELIIKWHETQCGDDECGGYIDEQSPFVSAMARYHGTSGAFMTLDVVNSNLMSVCPPRDAIPYVYEAVQEMMALTMCENCDMNVLNTEEDAVCLTCIAGLAEDDLGIHMCGVCRDTCCAPIRKTRCCGQWIHKVCQRKCGKKCPFCRTTTLINQAGIQVD